MRYLITFIFFALSIGMGHLHAQEAQTDVIPPSPTAAALGKYGDIPVSLYTGIPNISIPLFEIKEGDITVPISLSYHAGGIKVGEIASWAGLGWSLNAGGTVTRTVQGKADEKGYFVQSGANEGMKKLLELESTGKLADHANTETTNPPAGLTEVKDFFFNDIMGALSMDYEPDRFFFNVGGASGKFIYDYDKNVHIIPHQKIDINANFQPGSFGGEEEIEGFTIVTPNGMVHEFNIFERTETTSINFGAENQQIEFNSTWHLTKITSSATDRSVEFFYTTPTGTITQDMNISSTKEIDQSQPGLVQERGVASSTTISTKYLERIEWDGGEIILRSSPSRTDLLNAHRLDAIDIYDNLGKLVKTFEMTYSTSSVGDPSDQLNNHLILESVREISGPQQLPPYEFSYENINQLPRRDSYGQDLWGFYNGSNNSSLVPPFFDSQGARVAGANRLSNFAKGKTGILTRIDYPTGGYTDFEYEPHDYYLLGNSNFFTRSRGGGEGFEVLAGDDQQFFCGGFGTILDFGNCPSPCSIPLDEITFTTTDMIQGTGYVEVQIFRPENVNESVGKTSLFLRDGVTDELLHEYKDDGNCGASRTYFHLEPDRSYKLVAQADINTTALETSKVIGKVFWEEFDNQENIQIGGLRIKRIESKEGNSLTPPIIKTYTYRQKDDREISSGVLVNGLPDYADFKTEYLKLICENGDPEVGGPVVCAIQERQIITINGYSNTPLGITQGSHIAYWQVKETFKQNGWKWHTFTDPSDIAPQFLNPPNILPNTSNDWKRGLLRKEEVYDQTGRLVQETENEYVFIDDENSNGIDISVLDATYTEVPGFKYKIAQSHPLETDKYKYEYGFYDIISAWYYIKKTTVRTIGNIDNSSSTVNTTYEYGNTDHLQVTRTTLTNSNGEVSITENNYAEDYTGNEFGSDLLRAAHMHGQVLERTDLVKRGNDDVPISRSETHYSDEGGPILPKQQINYFKEGTGTGNAPGKSIQVDYSYDDNGNITEVKRQNGNPTAYIWGYKGTLPIAKVDNASIMEVAFTDFESIDKGGWTYELGGIVEDEDGARTGYSYFKGDLTHPGTGLSPDNYYIVSFWSKDAAPVVFSVEAELLGKRMTNGWEFREYRVKGGQPLNINGPEGLEGVRLHPEDALMTTFTYDPLRGMDSATDPSGKTIYYEYDGLGRLSLTRDLDGNILNKYEYNYRTN